MFQLKFCYFCPLYTRCSSFEINLLKFAYCYSFFIFCLYARIDFYFHFFFSFVFFFTFRRAENEPESQIYENFQSSTKYLNKTFRETSLTYFPDNWDTQFMQTPAQTVLVNNDVFCKTLMIQKKKNFISGCLLPSKQSRNIFFIHLKFYLFIFFSSLSCAISNH